MLQLLCNAFNDPSDPWYYVIGVLFLIAIFGALAVYIILSNKKNKKAGDNAEQAENSQTDKPNEQVETKTAENDQASEAKAEATEAEGEGTDTVNEPKQSND